MHASRLLHGAVLIMVTGCYSYSPAGLESIHPGHAVRVRLTAAEAERLEPIRVTDARLMEGTVVERSGVELLVDSHVGSLDPQRGTRALVQRINVPVAEIQEIELRRLDMLKTGAAVGGFALATTAIILAARGGGIGGRDGGGDLPEFRRWDVPALRIRF